MSRDSSCDGLLIVYEKCVAHLKFCLYMLVFMEIFEELQGKQTLDIVDATTLLQFLQEQTAPLLSVQHVSNTLNVPVRSTSLRSQHPTSVEYSRSSAVASPASLSALRSTTSRHHTMKDLPTSYQKFKVSDQKLPLNISSMEEFPPMGAGGSNSGSKRGKGSSKPSRRITLTPLESQPPTLPFSMNSSPSNSWKVAFTSHCTSSEMPVSLTEERRLLQQERNKRRLKQNRTTPGNRSREQQVSQSGHNSGAKCGSIGSNKSGYSSSKRGESYRSGQSSASYNKSKPTRSFEEAATLDSKISEHSIFELNPTRVKQVSNIMISTSKQEAHYGSSASASHHVDRTHRSPCLSSIPLTSTPMMVGSKFRVSLEGVTTPDSLEVLAELYASLIKDGLLLNLTSEIHFILQLLTAVNSPVAAPRVATQGSSDLFNTVDDCVYFAVAVLSRIRKSLILLDQATLQLFAENTRIAEFQPDLVVYFSEASKKSSKQNSSTTPNSSWEGKYNIGVPFQEETDNSKNFPDMKAFHAFKKQRDTFYYILREWEKHHNKPNWSLHNAAGDKIQTLIREHGEFCSPAHFARLFQKQLIESCRHPLQNEADIGGSLMGQLSKTDPKRLMRLNKRFFIPSSGGGPCPPPSFSQTEDFFTEFILAADSYVFNHHLKLALYAELIKLHSSCHSGHLKDLTDVLQNMRLLAKFLGFLDFLPYRHPSPEPLFQTREMAQSFNLLQCVLDACEHGHVCMTVPWVVEYLSMMDSQASKVAHYRTLVTALVDVYRSLSLRAVPPTHSVLLVLTCLGWLFETCIMLTTLFYEHVKSSRILSVDITHIPNSLDAQNVITMEQLYICCPFLSELRSMLNEFAAGLRSKTSPIRKIKPISTDIEPVETSLSKQLQLKLEENFFRSHPPYLKQLCDIVSERVVASVIAHCEGSILPQHVNREMITLTKWLQKNYSDMCTVNTETAVPSDQREPFSNAKAERQLLLAVESTLHSVTGEIRSYLSNQCWTQAYKALDALLSECLSEQVITAAAGMIANWSQEKCTKWSAEKIQGLVKEELFRGFERARRVTKTAIQRNNKSLTHNTLPNKPAAQISGLVWKATSKEIQDLISSEEKLSSPEQLQRVHLVFVQLHQYIQCAYCVIPGVPIPQVVLQEQEEALSLTVDLAVRLITQGLLRNDTKDGGDELPLIHNMLTFWKFVKNSKFDLPLHQIMSASAFNQYLQQGDKCCTVWQSLSDVLVSIIQNDVASSPVVEGLWLCRKQQLSENTDQVRSCLRAASIFLKSWFFTVPSYMPNNNSKQFKEVHFLRLLNTVHKELNPSDIPSELLSPQLVHLSDSVFPF